MINELRQYGEVVEHASLKEHNTYHIAGSAKLLIRPNNIDDLISTLKLLKENNFKFYILGNGSNIIINDKEYDGAVVKLDKLNGLEVYPESNMAYAEAGVLLPRLALEVTNNGLTGLEFAAGIPGSVGGSIYGNAGAYNACILDYVKSITVLDEEYNIKILNNEDITYSYRTSTFKETKRYIILAAKFYVKSGDRESSLEIIADRRKRRIESQPLEYPSAGSVFRNPEGDFAGRLIESCGLKGTKLGGAEVSVKHANFIVNTNNATGKDVHDLIMYVHDKVKDTTNVDLKIEQEFIDWE